MDLFSPYVSPFSAILPLLQFWRSSGVPHINRKLRVWTFRILIFFDGQALARGEKPIRVNGYSRTPKSVNLPRKNNTVKYVKYGFFKTLLNLMSVHFRLFRPLIRNNSGASVSFDIQHPYSIFDSELMYAWGKWKKKRIWLDNPLFPKFLVMKRARKPTEA